MIRLVFITIASLILCRCGADTSGSNGWYDGLLEISGWGIVDRAGLPGTSLLFMSGETETDEFNVLDDDDEELVAQYRSIVKAKTEELRDAAGSFFGNEDSGHSSLSSEEIAELAVPDVLVVDLGTSTNFPNGRNLKDDAPDKILGMALNRGGVISGGAGVKDDISNDNTFEKSFPYLADEQ